MIGCLMPSGMEPDWVAVKLRIVIMVVDLRRLAGERSFPVKNKRAASFWQACLQKA